MPPKSDYWKYFVVQGVLAICQIEGCAKPNVSLGSAPKPGQKKRISKYILYTTAALYHNAFFQQPVPSPTTWSSITKQSNIHGSWEAVQCSRTDYGFKEEQIVTHICWQAALPSRGSPLGHLQTWLEVKNLSSCCLWNWCTWNKCTFNCTYKVLPLFEKGSLF